MSMPPAGWYQDPGSKKQDNLRWWNGSEWTDHHTTKAAQATQATAGAPAAKSARVKPLTIAVGIAFLLIALVGALNNGLSGFLIVAALLTIGTAVYTLITTRPSWALCVIKSL